MYSRIAGTGTDSASAGRQIRAASRVPSLSGIQTGSRRSTDRGKLATVVTAPHYTGLSLKSRLTDGRDRSYAGAARFQWGGS